MKNDLFHTLKMKHKAKISENSFLEEYCPGTTIRKVYTSKKGNSKIYFEEKWRQRSYILAGSRSKDE